MAAAWPARAGTDDYGWGNDQEDDWGFDRLDADQPGRVDFSDLFVDVPTMPPIDYNYYNDNYSPFQLVRDLREELESEGEDAARDLPTTLVDIYSEARRRALQEEDAEREEDDEQEEDDDVIVVQSHSRAGPTSSLEMGNEQSSINTTRAASHGSTHRSPHSFASTSPPSLQQTPPRRGNGYEDWLEHTTRSTSTLGHRPDDFFDAVSDHTPHSPALDIEDLDSEGFEEMPTLTRGRRESVVDLTADPSSLQQTRDPRTRTRPAKRNAETLGSTAASGSSRRPVKRQRPTTSGSASASTSRRQAQDEPIEELDLTQSPTSALRAAEQARTIAAQQASEEPSGPLRIGQRQCIICMEAYTNATVTPCGHIYCHECLDQALKQGEKNSEKHVGTCPVCRQEIPRDEKKKSKKGGKPVAIAFMKKSAYSTMGRPALEAGGG